MTIPATGSAQDNVLTFFYYVKDNTCELIFVAVRALP